MGLLKQNERRGKMGRKWKALLIAVIIVAISGSVFIYQHLKKGDQVQEVDHIEDLGGKYNASITVYKGSSSLAGRTYHYGEINYLKDGKNHSGYYSPEYKDAFDWMRLNTPENATILCWWDYGHMVVGYAERKTVVANPSPQTLYMVANSSLVKEFSNHEMLVDVADSFTTSDPNRTISIMERYGADYILVTDSEKVKAPWIFNVSGLDSRQYLTPSEFTEEDFTGDGKTTMIYRLLFKVEVPGSLQLVYEDDYLRIYKRVE